MTAGATTRALPLNANHSHSRAAPADAAVNASILKRRAFKPDCSPDMDVAREAEAQVLALGGSLELEPELHQGRPVWRITGVPTQQAAAVLALVAPFTSSLTQEIKSACECAGGALDAAGYAAR